MFMHTPELSDSFLEYRVVNGIKDSWTGFYSLDGNKIFVNDYILTKISHCGPKRKTIPSSIRVISQAFLSQYKPTIEFYPVCVYFKDAHLIDKGDWRQYPHLESVNQYNIDRGSWAKEYTQHLPKEIQTRTLTDAFAVLGNFHESRPETLDLKEVPEWLKTRFDYLGLV